MYVKKEAPFTMRDSAKTLAFLCKAEKELKRKRLLSRLLPPVGTVLFMFNLLIASVNTIRFACGEELSKVLDEMPVLPALADGMQGCFSSWSGVIASMIWFVFLIPLAVCGLIVLGFFLYERYHKAPEGDEELPKLTGNEAKDARMLVERAETVYLLRGDFLNWSVYLEACILTALLALPLVIAFVRMAGEGVGATLQLTVVLFVLLVCLFGLYWLYVLLLWCFTKLLTLMYPVPDEWMFWELYHKLDVYWESVDPVEFSKREHLAARRAAQQENKWWRRTAGAPKQNEKKPAQRG